MTKTTDRPRKVLTDISPTAWEHPADRAALTGLRKVPGFDRALRKVFGLFGERSLRLAFRANAVRVTEKQYPEVHARMLRVCDILDRDDPPELYISQTPVVNAGAVGMDEPFIVLNSSMLEVLSLDEVEAVLGHEVGHILSGHVLYRTLLVLLLQLTILRHPLAGIAIRPILFGLLEWYRKSELSSDRAGLLAVQDPDTTMSALMELAGGLRGGELNLEEFVAQSDEYRESEDLLDSVYKTLNLLGATHPFAVIRVAELRDWIESGDYDTILSGEYTRQGTEEADRPYREDLAEAMAGYRETADEFLDQMDATVDRLRNRMGEAWRRSEG